MSRLLIPLFTILVSVIYGLGNIYAYLINNKNLDLLELTQTSRITRDEIFAYAPFVKHILKGNFFLGDVYTYEYSNYSSPFIGETAPALAFAAISVITGSIEKSFVAADFIFPPIIFLLFYFFMQFFVKNKLFSIAVAFLVVMMRDFIAVIPYPEAVIDYLLATDNQLFDLIFSRSFHPQLTFIFFLASVLSLFRLIIHPSRSLLVITGILLAILFYSYIFYWTYFLAFMGLAFLYFVFEKDFKKGLLMVKVLLIALPIGLFYLYNIVKFYQLDLSQDFIQRTALMGQPIPLTIIRYLLIAVIFLIVLKRRSQRNLLFFLFLATGLLIPIVSKVAIGADLETHHYLRRVMMPFYTIALFLIMYKFLKSRKFLLMILSVFLISISILFSIKAQILTKERAISDYQIESEKEVYTWLKNNTKSDDVVGSLSIAFNLGLPAYTNNKVYFGRMDRTIMPTNEGVERYVILSNLLGITKEQQKKRIREEILLSYIFAYQAYSKIDTGDSEEIKLDINSPRRAYVENKIESFQKNDLNTFSKKYKLDYFVVTPTEFVAINPNLEYLEAVTSINDYILFKKR